MIPQSMRSVRVVVPDAKAGIYLNTQANVVRRVGAGVNAPASSEWVKVTDDPNMGLLAIRQVAQTQGIGQDPAAIKWEF